jgi:Flp pilus assembly protein TadG
MRTSKRSDHGLVSIEFVLVAPFLFMLLYAIAMFGVYAEDRTSLAGSAQDIARANSLALTPPATPTGATATGQHVCTTTEISNHTGTATVTLTKSYTFDLPVIPFSQTITETGSARCGGG